MLKHKSFEEQCLRPQVNQRGAKSFVRNALFDVNAESSSTTELKREHSESNVNL